MSVTVPAGLRASVIGADGGPAWLESVPTLAARAAARWDLRYGEPFETGMAAWTTPATTSTGIEVVVKLSLPHPEARDEAVALTTWNGVGAVTLLDAHEPDWALLLPRLRPGVTLRDADLTAADHVAVGADVLRLLMSVDVGATTLFRPLDVVADESAVATAERIERVLPIAPYAVDVGLCHHAVDLLRTLPASAGRRGLTHGDLNPGNIVCHHGGWLAIDPKPVFGDPAWDPWPLLTQVSDWTGAPIEATALVERTRLLVDATGLDPARVAAWSVARSVDAALWAADRGWWTGHRGADGDLARARAWASAAMLLGG